MPEQFVIARCNSVKTRKGWKILLNLQNYIESQGFINTIRNDFDHANGPIHVGFSER